MSVLGLDSGYKLQEFRWALAFGTPSGKVLYLTVYPSSCPNMDKYEYI